MIKKIFKIPVNSDNRHKWVKEKLLKIKPGKSILDAGCGTQRYKKYCSHLKYFSQDFGEYDSKGDGKNLQIDDWNYGDIDYKGDIWNINESDEKFDAILCTEVLEHISFPNETIQELARLLKPEGVLIVTAPFSSVPHMTPYYFYSGFHKNWYLDIASRSNLKVVEIVENGDIYNFVSQELNRIANIQRFFIIRLLLKIYFRLFIVLVLNILSSSGKKQALLPFGYHVVMKK
jgi:ubiquinone/menaquinone biosynthesis C-methylase UbiE